MQHSGSQWIESTLKIGSMSPLGKAVADLLGDVWSSIYHLDTNKLKKVDWSDPHCLVVQLAHQSLATFDGPILTWLVVLCHDRCLRMDINAVTVNTMQLVFHQRQREGRFDQRMPTIEEHIASIRKYFPLPTAEVPHESN